MPTFIGFSTAHVNDIKTTPVANPGVSGGGYNPNPLPNYSKKFSMIDQQLVIQDLLNSFNILQGQKPGMPSYGTTIWNFIFEPNTLDMQSALKKEIFRVASLDPRLVVNSVGIYPQSNGILAQVELAVVPFNDPTILSMLFDQNSQTAYSVGTSS